MSLFSYSEILQAISWLLALLALILSLYILLLNWRHAANRHVSILLLLFATNNFALGALLGATDAASAWLSTVLLAATSAAVQPAILLVTVVLLKPQWLPTPLAAGGASTRQVSSTAGAARWRWIWWPVYALALLPVLLTVIDLLWAANLWYTGIQYATYAGGHLDLSEYANGTLAPYVRTLNIYVLGTAGLLPILYVLGFDKKAAPGTRRLAWLLLATLAATLVSQFALRGVLGRELSILVSDAVLVLGYAYAAFQQMISERRTQRGHLQTRLTVLILVVAVPLLVAVVAFVSERATLRIEQQTDEQLALINAGLAGNLTTWLDLNIQSLQQLALAPDIISMDPNRQKPLLEAMERAHPHMYLVSTTDLSGRNVARSDDVPLKDYGDRDWVHGARDGHLTFQVLTGRTSGEPALVIAQPILDPAREAPVGVAMLASDLDDLAQAVRATRLGENGHAFVVNEHNQVVAHPDPEYASVLQDLSLDPAVRAVRRGARGAIRFEGQDGEMWRGYVDELGNGWAVVVQQPRAELALPQQTLRWVSWGVIGLGALLLIVLTTLTVRQAIYPIGTLTETATAIATGDLDRTAAVESQDEIGALAAAFNTMTAQLRELVTSLEDQVTQRTTDLARRTAYLQATADVGRSAASMLDVEELAQQVTELIRQRFGLYYVGLFQLDQAGEWAVLRAGTGQAGRAMLARGHRIRVGEGMVGWAATYGESRVALEAGEDAVRLATPELPETRSEAALPLRSRGRVIGALTVQHTEPGIFDEDTMAVLQTMADQVALALDNAQLLAESQQALEAARRAFGEVSREAWLDLLQSRGGLGYLYTDQAVAPVDRDWRPEMLQALETGQTVRTDTSDSIEAKDSARESLAIPLQVRDQVIGVLGCRKPEGQTWTDAEIELLQAFTGQFESALESARLYRDTQRRAVREQLVGQVTSRMRQTLDVEGVLRTAIEETRHALGLPEVIVRLRDPASIQPRKRERDHGGNGRDQDHTS